jgi:hypothetical protein
MNAQVHVEAQNDNGYHGGLRYRVPAPVVLFALEEQGSGEGYRGRGRSEAALEAETASDWCRVHERIVGLAAERAAHERELCRWLRAAERLGVHARTGYGSMHEYGERVLGLRGRQVEERLRVARALAELPALDEALASGTLCWSAVRELTRVATPETERAWLGWAKGRRSRQIEQAVAARRQGDRPSDRPDASLVKHRLRFEVRAETMALFRDLQARVRAELGGAADDDTLLYEIARRALGGPADEGRAGYQVAVTVCPECARASIDAGGECHEVDDAVAEMAGCDCQEVPGDGCGAGAAPGAPAAPANDVPHMGARPASVVRATQSIPPAVRRAVKRRDRGRCVVEGCQNHLFIDVHHVVPRSEGGRHDPDGLCCLCGAHHRAVHRGTLVISGTAESGFSFRHADGTPYGQAVRPAVVEVAEQVLGALRKLGFPQTRARALVDTVLRDGAPGEPAEFLRAALVAA